MHEHNWLPVILSICKEDPQERLSLPGDRNELCKLGITATSWYLPLLYSAYPF